MKNTYYVWGRREKTGYAIIGYMAAAILFYLFYHHILFSAVFAVIGAVLFPYYKKKQIISRSKWQLMVEFKDVMDSMVSALAAGYSMENAVSEAYKDLKLMNEKETSMLLELKNMREKVRLKQPLDKLLLEFGRQSGVEDILTFAQIYATARRSGGNLVKIMKRTADNIGEKMEIQQEIQTMIAGKRMESLCMTVIPLLIILYMQIFSPGFLDPLYEGAAGRLFMSGALIFYILAACWSQAIMNIRC